MKRKTIILFALICQFALVSKAQEHHCGSTEQEKQLLEKHPEYIPEIKRLEAELNNIDKSTLEKNHRGQYIIPIVYHILHNYGTENISDAQIQSDVKTLNERYNKKNADTSGIIPLFVPLIANVGIEFRLANKDPNGECTNGIDRIATYKTYFADDQSKFNPWNRSRYLNIWVAHTLKNPTAAAYAYKPPTADFIFYYDGVLAWHSYVGSTGTSNYNNSKTITHEIGHCLNLDHTWGGTNEPEVACGDDGVVDTPPTKGHLTNCSYPGILYDSTCTPGVIENVQNVMDYSYCYSEMFTLGQAERMLTALNSPVAQRSSLFSAQTLALTGVDGPRMDCAPKADFNVNRKFACVGNSLSFTNKSYNDTTNLTALWDFTASGNPTTSTSLNTVTVSFTSPGWKNISLVDGTNAGTGSITKDNYVFVADPVGKNVIGQINNFEDETVFNNTWANFNYYNNNFKFEYFPFAGYSGTKCFRYHGFDDRTFPAMTVGSANGDIDEIITEAYDLSSGLSNGNAFLNFFYAGATRATLTADLTDSLLIEYSINCGATWINMAKMYKADIANNGNIMQEFDINGNTTWDGKSFAIPQNAFTSSTFFKFRYRPSDYSNNVYIDNFEINSTPVSIKDINLAGFEVEIVPNPANDNASIKVNTKNNATVNVLITNIMGGKVSSFSSKVNTGTINNIEIPKQVFSQKGLYFVTLEIDGKQMTKKLVIQ